MTELTLAVVVLEDLALVFGLGAGDLWIACVRRAGRIKRRHSNLHPIGLVIENFAPPRGDALRNAVERSALPILILVFVAAGASLRFDALRAVGALAGSEYPAWGLSVETFMMALHELVGPILFRNALAQAGEIGEALP